MIINQPKLILSFNTFNNRAIMNIKLKQTNKNGKYGFINESGVIVIPCQWKAVGYFADGLAQVQDENDKWGVIDETGKVVEQCQ